MMNNDNAAYESLRAHLSDLQEKSALWYTSLSSQFLNEEEQAVMQRDFPEGTLIHYDGGYQNARKKKVIFRYDQEDDFSDIVCLKARVDQRFRKIGHRDILGALMHLQIDRHSFGDFWIADGYIYLYTSENMAEFLMMNLTKINQLSVSFRLTDERPQQVFATKQLHAVVASQRMDAIVAGLVHCSRAKAKEMIHQGLVQLNHMPLEQPDKLCDNNATISIRGTGRFVFKGIRNKTKSDRIVAEFEQSV